MNQFVKILLQHNGLFFLFVAQIVLLYSIISRKSCAGISGKTQFLYAIAFSARYFNAETWNNPVYEIVIKIIHFILIYFTMFLIFVFYKKTYKNDNFSDSLLILPCGVMALIINSKVELWNILWTFSIYVEAVAIFPQTYVLHKRKHVETNVVYYVGLLSLYKLLQLVIVADSWVAANFESNNIPMAGAILQLIFYCDFMLRNMKISKTQPRDSTDNVLTSVFTTKMALVKESLNAAESTAFLKDKTCLVTEEKLERF